MDTISQHAKKLSTKFSPAQSQITAAALRIESAKRLAVLVLRDRQILDSHRRLILSLVQWFVSEAYGKYSTRYRSERVVHLATHDPTSQVKINHEHVFTRAYIVEKMLADADPERAVQLLDNVVGCVVTQEEHSALENSSVGWGRYGDATPPVQVLDMFTERLLSLAGPNAQRGPSEHRDEKDAQLAELVADQEVKYTLGKAYNPSATHNRKSWCVIQALLTAYGAATTEQLSIAVQQHSRGGGRPFVMYLIGRGYLVEID